MRERSSCLAPFEGARAVHAFHDYHVTAAHLLWDYETKQKTRSSTDPYPELNLSIHGRVTAVFEIKETD